MIGSHSKLCIIQIGNKNGQESIIDNGSLSIEQQIVDLLERGKTIDS